MTPTTQFSLECHEGPREKWPLRSRLLDNGKPTPACIPGFCLGHQFAVPDGFLFIADYDCPLEESQHIALVSRDYHVLATKMLGWPYCSFLIDELDWLNERQLRIKSYRDDLWLLTIRSWGVLFLFPRLALCKLGLPDQAANAKQDFPQKSGGSAASMTSPVH